MTKPRVAALVVLVCSYAGSDLRAQVGRGASPEKVAGAMVTALKANPGGLGQFPALSAINSLEGEEKAAFDGVTARVRVIALARNDRRKSRQLAAVPNIH